MRKYIRSLAFCMLLAFVLVVPAAAAAPTKDNPVVLKFEHDMAPGSLVDVLWGEISEKVLKASDGRIKIEVYASMSLSGGKIPTMTQNLIMGSTDMGQLGGTYSSFVKEIGVYNLPFLTNGIKEMNKLTALGNELSDKLYAKSADIGIFITSVQSRNLRQFANTRHTIRTPADIKGMTFRTSEDWVKVETFKALGVNPIVMPFSDLPMAMTTGAVDGAERPIANLGMEAWWELGKYITISDYSGDTEMIGMNLKKWQSLGPELQKILRDVLFWAQDERLTRELKDANDVIELLKKNGCEVTMLTDAEKAAFAALCGPVWDKFSEECGPEWIEMALKILNKKRPA